MNTELLVIMKTTMYTKHVGFLVKTKQRSKNLKKLNTDRWQLINSVEMSSWQILLLPYKWRNKNFQQLSFISHQNLRIKLNQIKKPA